MMLTGVSRRLGCTEGQLYTMATGTLVAALLALAGSHPTRTGELAGVPFDTTGALPLVAVPPATTGPATVPPPIIRAPGVVPAPISSGPLPSSSPVPVPTTSLPVRPTGPALLARIGSPGAPSGLAASADGHVFVTTDNGTAQGVPGASKVFELGPTGRQLRDLTITGQVKGHAYGLRGAAVNPVDNSLFVGDVGTATVVRIDAVTHAQRIAARVPDVQPCPLTLNVAPCEPGLTDHAPELSELLFSDRGELFIADAGQATLWRWTAGKTTPMQWYSSTDLATGDGPAGLAFSATGSLLFTAGTTLDTSNVNAGGLYSLAVGADGSPGARTLLAGFASGARPGALVVDPTGPAYVILRGSGTLSTFSDGVVKPFSTAGTPIPLDSPSGLAFQNGRLLVTNGTASKNAAHWVVLSFPGLVA